MPRSLFFLFLGLLMLTFALPTLAVMSGYPSQSTMPNDPDHAAGLQAFERQDWQGVVDHMREVIARRPWDDQAHTLMGYAYRKLGHYARSLDHYRQGLDLNPYHRGALAYLGETYLAMGCKAQAHAMLTRLETACKRTVDDLSSCEEWHHLKTAIATYQATSSTTTAQKCPESDL